MPAIRMAVFSAFWFGLTVNAEETTESSSDNDTAEAFFSFDALLSRVLNGPSALSIWDKLAYFAVLAAGFECFNYIAINLGDWINAKHLPVRGHHLDVFGRKDRLYLLWNKIANGPFVILAFMYINWDPNYLWRPEEMTLKNVFLPFPLFFIIYDFFYTLGHCFLHQKGIYALIHKHHHRQQAPR